MCAHDQSEIGHFVQVFQRKLLLLICLLLFTVVQHELSLIYCINSYLHRHLPKPRYHQHILTDIHVSPFLHNYICTFTSFSVTLVYKSDQLHSDLQDCFLPLSLSFSYTHTNTCFFFLSLHWSIHSLCHLQYSQYTFQAAVFDMYLFIVFMHHWTQKTTQGTLQMKTTKT